MRVLITGASGFIGSHLCRAVRDRNWAVVATGRSSTRPGTVPDSATWLPMVPGKAVPGDAFANVDVVVHLAALVHQMGKAPSANDYERVNRDHTRMLADAGVSAGVKHFVYVSTIKVLGESNDATYDHLSAAAPADHYARSKFLAEQDLRELIKPERLSILRPPLVFGPGVGANFLKLMDWVRRGVPLPLAAIENRRSLLYVENLVDAICHVVASDASAPEGLPIADAPALSTGQLFSKLAGEMDRADRLFSVPPAFLRRAAKLLGQSALFDRLGASLQVDSTAFKERFSWESPFTIDEGLARTVAWHQHQRETSDQ